MNNLALYDASQSISSLISAPQTMPENYLQDEARNLVVNAYEFFTDPDNEDQWQNITWNQANWYVSPTEPDEFLEIKAVNRDADICGMIVPFTSKAGLNAGFTNT